MCKKLLKLQHNSIYMRNLSVEGESPLLPLSLVCVTIINWDALDLNNESVFIMVQHICESLKCRKRASQLESQWSFCNEANSFIFTHRATVM